MEDSNKNFRRKGAYPGVKRESRNVSNRSGASRTNHMLIITQAKRVDKTKQRKGINQNTAVKWYRGKNKKKGKETDQYPC